MKRAASSNGSAGKAARPGRTLLLCVLIGLVTGLVHLAEPPELLLRVLRNKLHDRPASGEIVLVAIDDRSLAETGGVPWGPDRLAGLLDRLRKMDAEFVHLETELTGTADEAQGEQLEAALSSLSGRVSLSARVSIDEASGRRTDLLPPARFARHAELVNTNVRGDWDGSVWHHPYTAPPGGTPLPSLAARLGGQQGGDGEVFPIDLALNPATVPVISASDVSSGRIEQRQFTGRKVVIARTDFAAERFWKPGHGLVSPGMLHILAGETLIARRPVDFGWLPPIALGALLAGLLLFNRRRWVATSTLGAAAAGALVGPLLLEQAQVHVTVLPGLTIVLIAAGGRAVASLRRSFHERGTRNLVSGLPNLQALRHIPPVDSAIVVVARIKNYAQITASLQSHHEKELVEQVVARLNFGTDGSTLYQADEGVFVWIARERGEDVVSQQIEALHALFRTPIVVAARLIDLTLTFGLDLDDSRPLLQRVPSALVAADGAAREGKRWASFNPATLCDAEWSMSLLARLDHAIDAGELWVAYQPKLDCRSGTLTGAEALVRWTHPEKGQIFPDQFIGAAEEGGRIERLTYHVLDQALETAASINAGGRRFGIAVNLSALLLTNDELVDNVEALLRRHRLAPQLLTLEVTETSTIGSAQEALRNLNKLAEIGVELSIDDYGTGFSTLEYLKRIPASELKIDRSFISMLDKSQSDRIMVNSTIQLAHSLGRKVVAEGVENEDVLRELMRMRCDLVQGYHIGRPVPLPQLLDVLAGCEGNRRAA